MNWLGDNLGWEGWLAAASLGKHQLWIPQERGKPTFLTDHSFLSHHS